jgi:hypothetical protein
MDKPNAIEPHKTSQTPAGDEPEWRGADQRGREAQERSGERGWGAGLAEKEGDGRGKQQGQGGARGGDLQNQNAGRLEEKGDARRRQGQTDKAGSGQGSKKN